MPYFDAAVGGGTMTAYLGAVDHRVTAAVRALSDQLLLSSINVNYMKIIGIYTLIR